MSPDRNDAPPPLSADFAQRVLLRARQSRRRGATLRIALGLGASLAVAVLVVRPGHPAASRHAPLASSALASPLASAGLGDVDVGDALDSDEGDPGSYFFPDAQVDSQLASEAQGLGFASSDSSDVEAQELGDGSDE